MGITLVIFLLTSQNGFRKTLAYLIAQALAFANWGVIFLSLSLSGSGTAAPETARSPLPIRTFLGILSLIMAVRVILPDQDPDALPFKWKSLIERISATVLFFQLIPIPISTPFCNAHYDRCGYDQLGLTPPGRDSHEPMDLALHIVMASTGPLAVYLTLRSQRDHVLRTLDAWMASNTRFINVGLLGGLGVFLVWGI